MDERDRLRARKTLERGTLGIGRPAPICLVYPSPYHVGMSSLGFQTLYRILNLQGIGAHRAFLPDAWAPASLPWPQPKQSIVSYEVERPISSYPVLGVSFAYELEIAGLVRMLEGAGIPPLAKDRGLHDPIVVGGGPITFSNPSLLLPFVDVLLCGEAELELPALLDRMLACTHRPARLDAAIASPHVVLGELDPGSFSELPDTAKAPEECLPAYSAIVTPETELSDMFLIEPERGCSRRCTFCVMRGSTNGGMRILAAERTLALVPAHARRVGLVGAAVTDHPELERLVADIVASGRQLGISSLRADRLTPSLLGNLAKGGYRTITVASDGISERVRAALRRKIREDDLLRAAELIRAHGFHRMKVYEMIGVPGETDNDVEELVRFARELSGIVRLTLTFSTFVAKRNTPLDGSPFLGVSAAEARLSRIREGLQGKVELRPQSPKWAEVEFVLAQRGPEVGHAALAAVRAGGRYADYRRAFRELGAAHRELRFGDEQAWARRKGKAATRVGLPMLPAGL